MSVNTETLPESTDDPLLSERQRAILEFVRRYLQEQSRPPTLREIAQGVGVQSTSTVDHHINRLVDRGYLRKQARKKRTLVTLPTDHQPMSEPTLQELLEEVTALRTENRRLREWCRQIERERAWERELHTVGWAG